VKTTPNILVSRGQHHVQGKLEQADFPTVVHPRDHRSQGIVFSGHLVLHPRGHFGQGSGHIITPHVVLSEGETVFQDGDLGGKLADRIRIPFSLLPKTFQQELGKLVRGQQLGLMGVDPPLPHPHAVHRVHLLGDQMVIEHRRAKGLQPLLRRHHHPGVLQSVMEIIRLHCIPTLATFFTISNPAFRSAAIGFFHVFRNVANRVALGKAGSLG